MQKDSKILIVGAGAFGTTTAYHLAGRGYTNVVVLDRYPAPSCEAATTDISKVIRSDYNEPLYARLGIESTKEWKTSDLFKDIFHEPGWVLGANKLSVPFVKGSIKTSQRLGVERVEQLTKDEVRKRFPVVTGGLDGWNILVWNPTAGWANLGEALRRMALAAQEQGVHYISGTEGHVKNLLHASDGTCIGVVTVDGTKHDADIVVIAAGARTPSLVDVSGQLTAKGHSVAHIQLTPEETKKYAQMPIFDNLELGYFFPPTERGIFKMAHSVFITNTQTDPTSGITTSIPHIFTQHPSDGIPAEIEATMRHNLGRLIPELSARSFCYERLCWDADTADRHFLICSHPEDKGLFFAAGGSAHGAKFLPVLGSYIADALEGKLEAEIAYAWRWRPGQKVEAKNLAHMDPVTELNDLSGWRGKHTKGLTAKL